MVLSIWCQFQICDMRILLLFGTVGIPSTQASFFCRRHSLGDEDGDTLSISISECSSDDIYQADEKSNLGWRKRGEKWHVGKYNCTNPI